jgi:hypothetical protein
VQTTHPPILAKVQTDGSYARRLQRIAAILSKPDRAILADVMKISAQNSTETEWASVALGFHLALRNSEG